MIQPLLFSQMNFTGVLNSVASKTHRSVELLQMRDFAAHTPQAIANSLFASNQMAGISIDTEGISQLAPQHVRVEAANADEEGLAPGIRFGFKVPYLGNKEWLQVAPTALVGAKPFGEIRDNEIFFQLEQLASDAAAAASQRYQSNISSICAFVNALSAEIITFNEAFLPVITRWVMLRKAQLENAKAYANVF